MKLKENAFANAAGVLSAILYILFYLINLAAPTFFSLVFNAQFLGADIASLVPAIGFGQFVVLLGPVFIISWLWGYFFAWFYNRLAK